MTDQILILFLFFLTGFSGFIFYFFKNSEIRNIRRPGLLLALGTLGGTVFFHLVPEYIDHHRADGILYGLLAVPGFLVWFIPGLFRKNKNEVKPSIVALIVGDAVHNAFTSLLWLSLCLVSGKPEMMVVPAIILHEIPHKAGNFGIMIFSGMSKKKAMLLNLFAGLFFFAGLILYTERMAFDGKIFMPVIIGTLSYTFFSGLFHERAAFKQVSTWLWLATGLFFMIFVSLLTNGWDH